MEMIAKRTSKRILAGSLIIIAGVLLLLSNIGFFDFNIGHVIFSWPSILIFIGIIVMLNSNFKSGFFIFAVGVIFLISRYYFLDFWTLWPVLLIIIGINSLLHARRSPNSHYYKHIHKHENWVKEDDWKEGYRDWKTHEDWRKYQEWKQAELNSDLIDESNVFSGSRKFINSSNFKGGRITAIFGGAEIDFSGCQLAPGNNILDIEAIFGGVTLFVPDDWKIIIETSPLFGDLSDERRKSSVQNAASDRALVIRGKVVFGGGKIKSA